MKLQTNKNMFSEKLLGWWKERHRDFPWRNTRDTYQTLISEVLLHRTKAEQVVSVYKVFLKKYPTMKLLSTAPISDVKRILHPLGLHWRTELLHQMAKEITQKYDGKIPTEKEELESLPGISHYIASAVRCFSLGYPEALLDTNTVRVLGRFFGIRVTDSSRRSQRFTQLHLSLIDTKHPRQFNYAMIDLGALVCKPKNPLCNICPLSKMCKYRIQKAMKN